MPNAREMTDRRFADLLLSVRDVHDITQIELARKLGVSRSLIAAIETNRRKPSVKLLTHLREHYRISLDGLFDAK